MRWLLSKCYEYVPKNTIHTNKRTENKIELCKQIRRKCALCKELCVSELKYAKFIY